jgi:hypothetical protein
MSKSYSISKFPFILFNLPYWYTKITETKKQKRGKTTVTMKGTFILILLVSISFMTRKSQKREKKTTNLAGPFKGYTQKKSI